MTQFVNLFDKPLKLVFPDNTEILLPASNFPVTLSYMEITQELNGMPFKLRTPHNPPVNNLPDPVEGVIYLVPSWIAVAVKRSDFVVAFAQATVTDTNLTVKSLFKQE